MAKLTAVQRQKLPKGDFALPGKGEGPKGAGAGSYPIPDEGHAKAALSRVKQFGNPGEQAQVAAKVAAKFPGMEVKGKRKAGNPGPCGRQCKKGMRPVEKGPSMRKAT